MVVVGQHHHDFVLPGRMQGDSAHCADRALRLRPMPTSPSWPFGFNPYRSCARFACLGNPAASPAARCFSALKSTNRLHRIGHRQRGRTLWRVALLRHSLQLLAHLRQQLIDLLQVVSQT